MVAGGVASNMFIRAELSKLAAAEGLSLVLPPPRWCTDNGVMIAWAGVERCAILWTTCAAESMYCCWGFKKPMYERSIDSS